MVICDTCGCTDFSKEAGFLYCNQCHTQSECYQEQESVAANLGFAIGNSPRKRRKKQVRETLTAADLWTSWDAFNYILYGMTQEVKNFPFAPKDLEAVVLQLWACQLQKSEVAFVSKLCEQKPKLGFYHRLRDLKIVYGGSNIYKKRKQRRTRSKSTSAKRIVKDFFQKQLENYSTPQSSDMYMSDTIESLSINSAESTSECDGSLGGSLRNIFTASDNKTYKKSKHSKSINPIKYAKRMNVNYFCKSKLLEIIHLALLLIGSAIQLGDLLRFIRESHLSYAKATQFLPEEIQLSKGDANFIETIRDSNMPTHLMQRKVGRALARCLAIKEVSLPDMRALITRYCAELNLPRVMVQYSVNILQHVDIERKCILNKTKYLPNFEALALASVVFVMKLLFGLDGMTEMILSDLAEKINNSSSSATDRKLFVFNNWQKHIECRKALLQNLHYPTEEKLKSNPTGTSKRYIGILVKESKDQFKEQRFKTYSQYYLDPEIVKSVKNVLESLKEPINDKCFDFPPCLTPYTSYLGIVLEIFRGRNENGNVNHDELPEVSAVTLNILNEDFNKQSLDFITRPSIYEERLIKADFNIMRKSRWDLINIKVASGNKEEFESETNRKGRVENVITFPQFSNSKNVVFLENPFDYWIVKLKSRDKFLYEFKMNVLHKTSVNFRWLLLECSAMLEMNTRELYQELTFIEEEIKKYVENRKS